MATDIWVWVGFNAALVVLFIFDFFVLTRGDREVSIKEAVLLTLLWTAIGVGTGIWILLQNWHHARCILLCRIRS